MLISFFFFFLRLASHWRAENFYVITLSETLLLDLRDHRPVAFPEARLRSCSPALLLSPQTIETSFNIYLSLERAKGGIEMSLRRAANHSVFELNYAS